jgi:hypothetical protein
LPFGGYYEAYIARCRRGGYAGVPARAAFWRSLGWPNLVLARAAKARKRLERVKREEWALARGKLGRLIDCSKCATAPEKSPMHSSVDPIAKRAASISAYLPLSDNRFAC